MLRAPRGSCPAAAPSLWPPHQPTTCQGTSLFLFSESNVVRNWVFRLFGHSSTEVVLVGAIAVNCVLLALDNPSVVAGSTLHAGLNVADGVFAALFALEMGMKIVAWGAWGCGDT